MNHSAEPFNTPSLPVMPSMLIQTYKDTILFFALKGYSLQEVKDHVFEAFAETALQAELNQEKEVRNNMAALKSEQEALQKEEQEATKRLNEALPKMGHPIIGLILTLVGLVIPVAISSYLFPNSSVLHFLSLLYALISLFAANRAYEVWFDKNTAERSEKERSQAYLSAVILIFGLVMATLSTYMETKSWLAVLEVDAYLVMSMLLHVANNIFGFNENRSIHSIFQYISELTNSFYRTKDSVKRVMLRSKIIDLEKQHTALAYDLGWIVQRKEQAQNRFLSEIELHYLQGLELKKYLEKAPKQDLLSKELLDALQKQEHVIMNP